MNIPEGFEEQLIRLRRSIHREPELGLDLPRTQARVLDALNDLGLDIKTGARLSSVTAILRSATAGPTVLLRADMDALPVHEPDGSTIRSTFPGVMHACGHDLHVAMLVGAARLLTQCEPPGNVIFMFQPGEETSAGARLMLEEGLLASAGERPVAAYALHVVPAMLPRGTVVTKPGTILGSSDIAEVTVLGTAGHSAMPHLAHDPVPVACQMVTALQTMVDRNFDAFDPVVVSVTRIEAGTSDNVIPDSAAFTISARAFTEKTRSRLRDEIRRLLRGIADAHGLDVSITFDERYPVTVNSAAETEFAAGVVRKTLGMQRMILSDRPLPAAEDFSFVLDEVPGTYLALGACPPDRNPAAAANSHSPEVVFDEEVISDGACLYAELAFHRLTQGNPTRSGQ